jgi:hypothetical protein
VRIIASVPRGSTSFAAISSSESRELSSGPITRVAIAGARVDIEVNGLAFHPSAPAVPREGSRLGIS